MKILLNIILAIIAIILTSPIIVLSCILILIFERKSPFFIQERLGINKIPFSLYKIRSMSQNKVTPIGKVIRKTGIDELPQLLNILKGDILFIGPRPLALNDIERLNWTGQYYDYRWKVKPGLTGLAQLSPLCHRKISAFWDRYYINHQSLSLDLKIALASFFILFLGKKGVKRFLKLKK